MKAVKIISLSLAALGLLIAIYGLTQMSDYRTVDKAWQDAADRRNDFLRHSQDQEDLRQAGQVVDQLSRARNDLRGRCQKVVIAAAVPLALGLILGLVSLAKRPRGWLPLASALCALAGGGLIGSMLGGGVF